MTRTAFRAAAASVVAAALLPAAATAATPKIGSYWDNALTKAEPSSINIAVGHRNTITAIAVAWNCKGSSEVDRTTTLVTGDHDEIKVTDGAFDVTRTATTSIGDPFDPADRKEAKAKARVTGRWVTPSKATGTVSITMPGCASGPLRYVAKAGPAGAARAVARAAAPKLGTFAAEPSQKGVKGTRLAIGVVDGNVVGGIGLYWSCAKGKPTDHQTTIPNEAGTKLRNGAFTVIDRKAYTVSGAPPDLDTGEAVVRVEGRFASAKKVTGTFSAKLGRCSTGEVPFTATWEGPPAGAR